jgi:Holliday junction resolvase
MITKESTIQRKIIKALTASGHYVIKLIQTNKNGIPDLLVIKPRGEVYFIEVKSESGKLSPLQKHRIQELSNYYIKTLVMDKAE